MKSSFPASDRYLKVTRSFTSLEHFTKHGLSRFSLTGPCEFYNWQCCENELEDRALALKPFLLFFLKHEIIKLNHKFCFRNIMPFNGDIYDEIFFYDSQGNFTFKFAPKLGKNHDGRLRFSAEHYLSQPIKNCLWLPLYFKDFDSLRDHLTNGSHPIQKLSGFFAYHPSLEKIKERFL